MNIKSMKNSKLNAQSAPPPTVQSFETLTNNIIAHCEINNGKVVLTRDKMKHAKYDVFDQKPIKPNEIRYYPQ